MTSKPLKRVIVYITTSSHKIEECKRHFDPYGVKVKQVKSDEECLQFITDWHSVAERQIVMGTIKEQTSLLGEDGERIDIVEANNLKRVIHRSELEFVMLEKSGDELCTIYTSELKGILYFNPDHKENATNVYDWDNVFVPAIPCGRLLTYQQLLNMGYKYSPRDNNLCRVVNMLLKYKDPINLHFNPIDTPRAISFEHDVKDYIDSVPQFCSEYMRESGLINILNVALNQGVYFRAPRDRRQKLYWNPGLNAGLPLTPKPKDIGHELAYQFHDFTHFNQPDLVFDGVISPLHELTYIAYRLISEACTLVIGDMIFVDHMLKSGYTYKTVDKRKLHPVYREMTKTGQRPDPYELIRGSYEHCFYKDDTRWKKLMASTEPLEPFADKYDKYVVEDFRWTINNYNAMKTKAPRYKSWWDSVKSLRELGHELELQSVSEFIKENKIEMKDDFRDTINDIFEAVYAKYYRRMFQRSIIEVKDRDIRRTNSFIRYMIGQCSIFFLIDTPFADDWFRVIKSSICRGPLNLDTMATIRRFYKDYLDMLQTNGFISADDVSVYVEMYPLYPPSIIDYDHGQFPMISEYVYSVFNEK